LPATRAGAVVVVVVGAGAVVVVVGAGAGAVVVVVVGAAAVVGAGVVGCADWVIPADDWAGVVPRWASWMWSAASCHVGW